MNEQYTTKNNDTPGYNYQLPLKILLWVTLIILSAIVILNVFFIEDLVKPELEQVYASGEITSIITSDFALSSMYSGKQVYVGNALNTLFEQSGNQSEQLLQISVILIPDGMYYASTNKDLQNKKAHPSLLRKIDNNSGHKTNVSKVNYKINNKALTVLQFLRNIVIKKDGKEIRIATTQVLYNYKNIIEKARYRLFVIGIANIVIVFIIIWIVFLPISKGHFKLIEALKQVKKKNLDHQLQPKSKDELGILFLVYNEMISSLKEAFLTKDNSLSSVHKDYFKGSSKKSGDLVLRKADITCLCARIPLIQEYIQDQEPGSISAYADNFLASLEKTIQANGGQIVKIIGDKTFGLFEGINSVDNAIRAALKCHLNWLPQNHERKVHEKALFDFGIGLHSAVGVVGALAASSENFTVVGEPASLAEYLCSCTRREEILISVSMMEKTNGSYQYQTVSELGEKKILDEEAFLLIGRTLEESLNLKYNQGDFEHNLKRQTENSKADVQTPSSKRSYDSSVPDILEETLSSTPLKLIEDNEKDSCGLYQGVGEHRFQDADTVKSNDHAAGKKEDDDSSSKSLWDKMSSEISTE